MGLKLVTWEDFEGRRWRSWLPEEAPDDDAPNGIPAGPPPLERLGLTHEAELRLHNELYERGLFTWDDARRAGRATIQAALQAALMVDVEAIQACYAANKGENDASSQSPEGQSVSGVYLRGARGTRRPGGVPGTGQGPRR